MCLQPNPFVSNLALCHKHALTVICISSSWISRFPLEIYEVPINFGETSDAQAAIACGETSFREIMRDGWACVSARLAQLHSPSDHIRSDAQDSDTTDVDDARQTTNQGVHTRTTAVDTGAPSKPAPVTKSAIPDSVSRSSSFKVVFLEPYVIGQSHDAAPSGPSETFASKPQPKRRPRPRPTLAYDSQVRGNNKAKGMPTQTSFQREMPASAGSEVDGPCSAPSRRVKKQTIKARLNAGADEGAELDQPPRKRARP
jgi:hypothetical protein